MSTVIRSAADQQNSEPDLSAELEAQETVEPQDSASLQTQETPQELTDHNSLMRYNQVLEDTLREQNRTIERLANRPAEPAPAPRDPEAENRAFYERPRDTIAEEISKQLAPLQEFVSQFQNKSKYDTLKDKYVTHPKFGTYLADPRVSRFVDNAMQSGQVAVTDEVMQELIAHAVGKAAVGDLGPAVNSQQPVNTPVPTNQPQTRNSEVLPPITRPSAPPNAPRQQQANLRQLTENEKTLARMKGQSDEEYLAWLGEPASNVVSSQIGKVTK